MTLSSATTTGQSGPGIYGNEGVFRIPQRSGITGTSPLDCLVLYPGLSLGKSYPSIKMSSSLCRAASTDIPDPLSPLLPIVHRFWLVFRATSVILTELLYVGSSWPSRFCSAICGGLLEYITYELVSASLAVSCMSGSSNVG